MPYKRSLILFSLFGLAAVAEQCTFQIHPRVSLVSSSLAFVSDNIPLYGGAGVVYQFEYRRLLGCFQFGDYE